MAKCIFMSGPAGAGKSTYAHKLLEKYNSSIIIASDDIRDEVYGGKFPGKFDSDKEDLLWKLFVDRTKEASKNYSVVILDSTCLTNKKRLKWYGWFKNYFKSFELVIVNRPLEVCVHQDSQRDRHVPEKDINQQINVFEEPNSKVKELFEVCRV